MLILVSRDRMAYPVNLHTFRVKSNGKFEDHRRYEVLSRSLGMSPMRSGGNVPMGFQNKPVTFGFQILFTRIFVQRVRTLAPPSHLIINWTVLLKNDGTTNETNWLCETGWRIIVQKYKIFLDYLIIASVKLEGGVCL